MNDTEKLFRIGLYIKSTMESNKKTMEEIDERDYSEEEDNETYAGANGYLNACEDIKSILDGVDSPLEEEVEWLFNFIGGGWNSVKAFNKEGFVS